MGPYVFNKEECNSHRFLVLIKSDEEYKKTLLPMNRFHITGYDNGKLGTFKNIFFWLPWWLSG